MQEIDPSIRGPLALLVVIAIYLVMLLPLYFLMEWWKKRQAARGVEFKSPLQLMFERLRKPSQTQKKEEQS